VEEWKVKEVLASVTVTFSSDDGSRVVAWVALALSEPGTIVVEAGESNRASNGEGGGGENGGPCRHQRLVV
jgi:hypothetical protein